MTGIYSGAAQQELWDGKKLKIGFASEDWTPNDNNYNLWFHGSITTWGLSGGNKSTEGVNTMGGFVKQYQKPQEEYEISFFYQRNKRSW